MKKYWILLVLSFLITLLAGTCYGQQKKYFRLNTNPENPSRQPDWSKELVMVLTEDSPTIEIGSANGKKSKGNLPTGSAVIIDSKSLKALTVTVCGNTIFTDWIPKGKIVSQREYKTACEEMILVLSRLNKLQEGMDELLERPNSNLSLAELKIMFQEELRKNDLSSIIPVFVPREAFNPFYFWNLIWEIPVVGLIVYGIVELVKNLFPKHHDNIMIPVPKGVGPGGNTGPIW